MAGEIVASNKFIEERANDWRTLFNSTHSLWLWQSQNVPKPADTLADYLECSFPGYARISLGGKWKPVLKVKDGEFGFSSFDLKFVATGPSNEFAVGWLIQAAGVLKIACRLPFPVLMTVGQSVTIRADCQTWALAIV